MTRASVKTFVRDYDAVFEQAGVIFSAYDLCGWERNADGTLSCVVNRLNSVKNSSRFIETDGCCINVCKCPEEHDDEAIKRRQHNNEKGCLVKSLKCKLHVCSYLRESGCPGIKEAVKKLDLLIGLFRRKYGVLWESVPFAAPKKTWIAFYKKQKSWMV